jgi:SAM-dependent methyltransferase
MDAETLEMCKPFCEKTLQANLEDPHWHSSLQNEKFDVVLCADVLEHLRDPRPLLNLLPSFLNEEGFVLMSLPNASHLTVVASLLAGRFPYQSKGLLDNTHLRFFGRDDIDAMLRECGLVWQKWETVQVDPAQAELQSFWHRLEAQDQAYLRERCADGMVYQHVVKAYPSSATGQLVKLAQDAADAKNQLSEKALAFEEAQKTVAQTHQLQIQKLEAQIHSQQSALTWTEEQLKNHQASLNWTEQQLRNHQQSLSDATEQLQNVKNALQQAQNQIQSDASRLSQLNQTLKTTEEGLRFAESEIESLKNSRSWRYTRFFRKKT